MAKSSKYRLDWSKLPDVEKSGNFDLKAGEWYFGAEDADRPLEELEHAIYANLALYLYAKERQSGGTEA